MGGTVAVCVRLESGEEYRMNRWTNTLPSFFGNIKFFQKDSSHIKEYLKSWKEMRADWNKNHKTKKFKLNMTDCYSPYPALLAPCSYGIVVFDFMKNVVISCQGYTCFTKANIDSDRCKDQIELFKAGMIIEASDYNENIISLPETVEEFERKFYIERDYKSGARIFTYNTSPFKVLEFNEYDYRKVKEEILNLGLKLSEEENKVWDEEIKEWEDKAT